MRIVLSFSLMFIASVASAQDNMGGAAAGGAPLERLGPPWERGLSNPNPGCSGESQMAFIIAIVVIVVGLLIGISMSRRKRHQVSSPAPQTITTVSAVHVTIQERIKKLSELRDAGLITAEEQEARRREILKDI